MPRDGFRFAPELFEVRNDVVAELGERGFDWLSHYSAVDPLHDVYGIEVCGIHEREDAASILKILAEMFPAWPRRRMYYKDFGRDLGWKAQIQRDKDQPDEHWETA